MKVSMGESEGFDHLTWAVQLPDLIGTRRLACAESCTVGRLAAELAAVGDAAEWLAGGIVAYQTSVKRDLLGVESASVVTGEAAEEMALGVLDLLGAEVSIATTGVLGEGPIDGVEPGTVFIATAADGFVRTIEHRVFGEPDERCRQAVDRALIQLVDHLDGRLAGSALGAGIGAQRC